jgi:hypothetical protein
LHGAPRIAYPNAAMLTGFNEDVEYDGQVFHVQTEDKGVGNPVIESLVYTGGEIVGSRRGSYDDLRTAAGFPESEVQRRMEAQHQAIIREVLSGRFDPDGPKPFGYNIITNRRLDEVVLSHLAGLAGHETIRLEIESGQDFEEGARPTLRLRVLGNQSDRPIAGAKVTVKLITSREKPSELFSGTTGPDGRLAATVGIPDLAGASAALLCQAEGVGNNAEVKQMIRKKGSTSGP